MDEDTNLPVGQTGVADKEDEEARLEDNEEEEKDQV